MPGKSARICADPTPTAVRIGRRSSGVLPSSAITARRRSRSPMNMITPLTIRKAAAALGFANSDCTCFWKSVPTSPTGMVARINRQPRRSSGVPCSRPAIALPTTALTIPTQSRQK